MKYKKVLLQYCRHGQKINIKKFNKKN